MRTLLSLVFLAIYFDAVSDEGFYDNLKGVNSIKAKFIQKTFDGEGDLLESAEGLVILAKPNKFKWIYKSPLSQEIISDGDKVWVFDPDLKQVTINDSISDERNFLSLAFGADREISKSYDVKGVLRKSGQGEWFEITPKRPSDMFDVAYVNFFEEVLSGFELKTGLNRALKVSFDETEINIPLDADFFRFVVPEGVDVIRGFLN